MRHFTDTGQAADMERVLRRRDLFGRERAGIDLSRFLTRAASDGGALALVGPPGTGKSALLDVAADLTAVIGARVLRLLTSAREADAAYATLDRLVALLSTPLECLPADQRRALEVALGLASGSEPAPIVVANSVRSLLEAAASSQPVLVLLDDAHLVDPPSALALGLVARRLCGSRVVLLAAGRNGNWVDGDRCVEDAGTSSSCLPGFSPYEVGSLDDKAASDLLESRFPELAAPARDHVLAQAQGNPLALIELSSQLGLTQEGVEQLRPGAPALPDKIAGPFVEQTRRLPARTREVLLLAALQQGSDLSQLCSTLADIDVLDALAPAERAGLITVRQNRYLLFRHQLLRSSLIAFSSAIEVRRAHRLLADISVEQPHQRTWHLAQATTAPDEHIARALDAASVSSMARGEARRAVSMLVRAAELSPARSARGRRLVEGAYICAVVTGELSQASSLLSSAREAEPASVRTLRGAIAAVNLLLNTRCDVESAHRLLMDALRRHGDSYGSDDEDLIDALYTLFMICWYSGSLIHWDLFRDVLARVRPPVPVLLELASKCVGSPLEQPTTLWDELDAATVAMHTATDPAQIVRTAICCIYTDRTHACREGLWRVIHAGREGGVAAASLSAITSSCVDDWLSGHWDEALELAAEGVQLSKAHGYQRFTHMLDGYIRPLILVNRGEGSAVGAAEAMDAWGENQHVGMFFGFAHHVRALNAIATDDFPAAYRHACAISPPGELPRYTPHALWMLLDVVESAVMNGLMDEAQAHVNAMTKADVSAISPRLAMTVAACSALTADPIEAQHLFQEAICTPGAERTPFDLARIHLLFGKFLRRNHSIPESRAQLLEALDIFDHLGAQPWARKARGELRATGLAGEMISTGGSAHLTQHELEIARLAAAGLSNRDIAKRLFLSDRTVGARLYRIFPKLGIASRAALRDALVASGIDVSLEDESPTGEL
ncbi:LuxR C-terminal-related transcriptional regulator [Streptomyces sp. NPDC005385]|uniref:LuxR C-terminal-related transcriptional regulator n=1 Tax=Streptomyces sp. NPDC005385 TaxID=3157039 RepID=UPI0033AC7EBD